MKRKFPALFSAIVILTLILTACGAGGATPTPAPAQPPDGGDSGRPPVTPLVPNEPLGADVGTTMKWIDGSILVYVPPGEFTMGHGGDDNPEHTVVLDGFWIYRTKVTNRMYAQCVALGACPPPEEPGASKYQNPEFGNEPIVGVNWARADAYCKWVKGFLPTEAQWEKTARGPKGNLYPWGDSAPSCNLLNFDGCVGGTTNVTYYLTGRSFYEALDMEGNTFEWISDWYDPNYYRTSPVENPMGPDIGKVRSVRSSSFASGPDQTLSANRFFLPPEDTRADLGFRCVIAEPVAPPFCVETSYRPGRPGRPGGGEPDLPGCELPDYSVAGAFCQGGNGYVNIDVGGPITDAGDYTVTADGEELDCSQTQTGRLTCSGITPDSKVEITVCGPGCDEGGDTPATTPPPDSGDGEQPLCATGYTYDTATGLCEYTPQPGDPTGGDCGPGYQTTDLGCEPAPNGNGDCPTGYYFDADNEACLPGGGQSDCYFGFTEYPGQESCEGGCPEGYYYEAELQCCALEGGGPGPGCPVGYYYDIELETCTPGDNGYDYPDCPEGYFYDTGLETCTPGGDTNCPEGYFYDTGLETCTPGGGDTGCPENYYYDTGLETCAPVPGGGQDPTCPDGYFYDTGLETCTPGGDDTNCPDGYYYDTGLESCTPGGGSGSNCASFSVYVEACPTARREDKGCAQYNENTCFDHWEEGCYWDTYLEVCAGP